MKKSLQLRWNLHCISAMLCALCFVLPCLRAAASEKSVEDPELQLKREQAAREQAERQVLQLSAALAKANRDIESLQTRYAELYLESREQARDLEHFQLRVAGLLTEYEEPSGGTALAEAIAYLQEVAADHGQLYRGIREFSKYLDTVLAVLQPSEGLRREIAGRYGELERAVDRLERRPSIVAGRGGIEQDRLRRESRLLAINDDLQVVVLDAGVIDGVRPGALWRVYDGEKILGMLKVIEVRPAVSAAMPVDGTTGRLAPGMRARAWWDSESDE